MPKFGRGRHQVREDEATETSEPSSKTAKLDWPPCPLATALLFRWGWGKLSANDVQDLAHCAKLAGLTDPEIDELAALGCSGHSPSHCHRDLVNKFCKNLSCVPEFSTITVPYIDNKGSNEPVWGDMSIIFPHDWMSTLSNAPETADLFVDSFGCAKTLAKFWNEQNATDNPKLKNHPVLQVPGFRKKTRPVTMHADGAQFQDRGSLTTLSVAGLLDDSAPVDKNLLVAAVPKECCAPGPEGTWPTIWKHVVWSYVALFSGIHPFEDADGNKFDPDSSRGRLAGTAIMKDGGIAVLWAFLADLDYFQKDLGLAAHASHSPCFLCQGNKTTIPYNDFGINALWKNTSPTLPGTDHVIMRVPGMTLWHFALDMLHVLEYGGAAHAIANIFFQIVYGNLRRMPRADACAKLWLQLQLLYEEFNIPHDHQLREFALKNFTDPDRPNLTYPLMRFCKAAEIKGLVKPAARLAEMYNDGTADSKHRVLMMANLAKVYSTIAEADMRLTSDQFNTLDGAMDRFLLHYSFLGKGAFDANLNLYSFVPKFHYMYHMIQQARFLNPRFVTCYSGEDYVGKVSQLGHTCLYGTASFRLSHAMFHKYRQAMYITFTRKL